MPVRQIDGWNWARTKAWLTQYQGPVVFASVALVGPEGRLAPLAATVRCGQSAKPRHHTYQRLAFGREMLAGGQAAWQISEGRWLHGDQAPVPPDDAGFGYRVTGGDQFGPLAPVPTAHTYYYWTWERPPTFTESIFDEPLTSSTEPWYPTAADALQELLYGRTRSDLRFDWGARLVVDMPYGGAHMEAADFVEDHGLVVNVAETEPGAAATHVLHAAWQLHPSSSELGRSRVQLTGPGTQTIHIDGAPIYWSVALLDRYGELADSAEQRAPREDVNAPAPLPALAVPEALDSLDWAWRLVFGQPLFQRPQLTSVADSALWVVGREDLVARLSSLADVLAAAQIDDSLLSSADAKAQGALNRMKLALDAKLSDPDKSSRSTLSATPIRP